jgi:hypothetical protein
MFQKLLQKIRSFKLSKKYIWPVLAIISLILNLALFLYISPLKQDNDQLSLANQKRIEQVHELEQRAYLNEAKIKENPIKTEEISKIPSDIKLPDNIYLDGSIWLNDEKKPNPSVTMVLTAKDNQIDGTLIYDQFAKPIKLEGKITEPKDNVFKLKLQEQDLGGNKTGIWNLELELPKNSIESGSLSVNNSTWQKDEQTPEMTAFLTQKDNQIVLPEFDSKSNELKITTAEHSKTTNNYSINYKYPIIQGFKDQKIQAKINEVFEKYADVAKTEKEFIDFGAEDTRDNACSYGDDSDFEVLYNKNGLLSVISTGYYFTCGAHGSHTQQVFNFDLSNGQNLSLKDVFQPNSKYLEKISQFSKDNIMSYYDDDLGVTLEEIVEGGGLDPKIENFDVWNFTKDGKI